jgi:hypothetical protein
MTILCGVLYVEIILVLFSCRGTVFEFFREQLWKSLWSFDLEICFWCHVNFGSWSNLVGKSNRNRQSSYPPQQPQLTPRTSLFETCPFQTLSSIDSWYSSFAIYHSIFNADICTQAIQLSGYDDNIQQYTAVIVWNLLILNTFSEISHLTATTHPLWRPSEGHSHLVYNSLPT